VLAVVVVIFVVLIAVGVHSCQVNADRSALKDYANGVSSVISRSDANGRSLFAALSPANGSANVQGVQNSINATRQSAQDVLSSAQKLSPPDSVKTAHSRLLLALQLRLDGIANISKQIQPALAGTTSTDAVNAVAGEMARFYGSDVLYKDYTAPALVSALHANGIDVGGASGQQINAGQFLPNVEWVLPSFIASELHVSIQGPAAAGSTNSAQGCTTSSPCGHTLNSVSVNGTTLQTGSPNTISLKPAPSFKLSLTNGGKKNETGVVCQVSVNGTSSAGQTTIPQTTAGQTATCSVPLKTPPAAGTYTVKASVEKVAGEKNTANNSQTYTVTFQ
jgi:Domain of unknown function DUF11